MKKIVRSFGYLQRLYRGAPSTQTKQNKFYELTYLRDTAKTNHQSTSTSLLFKLITCKLTLSHFDSQIQWTKRKHILRKERALSEDRDADYRGPPNFAKEQGQGNWQRILKHSVPYAVFCSLKLWKFHNTEEWIRFLFRSICLASL